MSYNYSTDEEIIRDLAKKLDNLRINKIITDENLCKKGGVGKSALLNFRKGKRGTSLSTFISFLRGIDELERLENFIKIDNEYRPSIEIQQKPKQKKTTSRVRSKKTTNNKPIKWGDGL
jgi:transcriptional regulator with XRE-family HTH domain